MNRRPLFRHSGVMSHVPSHRSGKQHVKGQKSLEKKDFRGAGNACDVFIEPVTWMADMILTIEGKVSNHSKVIISYVRHDAAAGDILDCRPRYCTFVFRSFCCQATLSHHCRSPTRASVIMWYKYTGHWEGTRVFHK